MNTTWGQYGYCNDGQCKGGDDTSVGREAAFGVMPAGGQCSQNHSLTGTWYSMREGARCNGDSYPGDGSSTCAWKTMKILKNITSDCLKSIGFLDACEQDDFNFPYDHSTAALIDALENGPENGGCPSVSNEHDPEPAGAGVEPRNRSDRDGLSASVLNTISWAHDIVHSISSP